MRFGVSLKKPNSIKQMINAGVHLELGQKGEIFQYIPIHRLSRYQRRYDRPQAIFCIRNRNSYPRFCCCQIQRSYLSKGWDDLPCWFIEYKPHFRLSFKESFSYGATLGTHWGVNRAAFRLENGLPGE